MKQPVQGKKFSLFKNEFPHPNSFSFVSLFTKLAIGLFLLVSLGGIAFAFSFLAPALEGNKQNNTIAQKSSDRSVLAAATQRLLGKISFNIPSFFNDSATFQKDITVKGQATFNGKAIFNNDIQITNHDLDLGTGRLTASNVLYGVTVGSGLQSTGGQNPTITLTNPGVTSFQGQSGDVALTAGSGIAINGTTISSTVSQQSQPDTFGTISNGSNSFSAGSSNDTLTFAAGSGVTIATDTTNKTLTFSSTSGGGLSGLTTNGVLYATGNSTATSLTPGTSGFILQSNGAGSPPSWVVNSGTSPSFSAITSGTNISAAMIVGSGASLNFTGSGTINASTLLGSTWASPGTIGSTTANTGAFTTLTGTTVNGLSITNNGSNTLSIASGKTFTVNNTLTIAGTDNTTFTLPSANDTLVGRNSTDTLTNKTIAAGSNTITGLTNSNLSGSAGITNANLANSSVTVTAGTGLSGGGAVTLGSSVTINNAGVLSLTSTQATFSASTGNITLSLPQNIDTSASPTFAGETLSNFISNNAVLYATSGTGALASTTTNSSNLCLLSGASAPSWTSCPTGTNYFQRNAGVISPATITDQLAIGQTTSLAGTGLDVNINALGNAATVINQTGSGDIFTASSSGTPKFTINNNGNIAATGGISGLTGITSSGTIMFSGLNSTGIVHNSNTGLLSTSLVSLTADVTGLLPVTKGGTGTDLSSSAAIGDLLYADSTTTFARRADVATGSCLISGGVGTAPTWGSCATGTTNYWQQNIDAGSGLGVLSPATIANTLAIGITNPLDFSGLEVDQNSKGNAVAVINQTGSGDILTASSSGTPKFTINNNGNIVATGAINGLTGITSSGTITFAGLNSTGIVHNSNTGGLSTSLVSLTTDVTGALPLANGGTNANLTADNGGIVYSGGSALAILAHNANVGLALVSGGAGTPSWFAPTQGSIIFAGANGALSQNNSNFFWDNTNNRLGLGVNSNLLGTLDARAMSGILPIATISGKTSFAALVADNSGSGDIFAASSSGLNRFVITQNGNVGINTTTPGAPLTVIYSSSNTSSNTPALILDNPSNASDNTSIMLETGGANRGLIRADNNGQMYLSSTSTMHIGTSGLNGLHLIDFLSDGTSGSININTKGYLGIGYGLTSPLATLDVRAAETLSGAGGGTIAVASISGATSFASLVVDNSGLGDIFSASTSGTPKFTIQNNGTIVASNYTTNGGLFYGNTSGAFSQLADVGTGSCLISGGVSAVPSWGSCGSSNLWQLNSGILTPSTLTNKLSIGVPTNTTSLATFDLRALSGTQSVASVSGATSFAALTVDNSGSGDLFAASSSGLNRFVITRNGNVGVGTATPTDTLSVLGSASQSNIAYFGSSGTNPNNVYIDDAGGGQASQLVFEDTSNAKWNLGKTATNGFALYDGVNSTYGLFAQSNTSGSDTIGIGTNNPLAHSGFDIEANSLGNATEIVNQLASGGNDGDIFTASSAGISRFTIEQNGNVILGGDVSTPSAVTVRGGAASGLNTPGGNITFDASNGTGTGGSGDIIFRTAAASGSGTTTAPIFDTNSTVQTHTAGIPNPVTWNFTATSQPNSLLIVTISYGFTDITTTGVSFDSKPLTKVTGTQTCPAGVSPCQDEMWYIVNPDSGTHQISVSWSGSSEPIIAGASDYYNVNTANPFGTIKTSTGTSAGFSVSATTTSTQLLVDAATSNGTGGNLAAGGGQTQMYESNFSQDAGSSYKASSGTSTTMSWTEGSSDSWAEIIAPINGAMSGSSGGGSGSDTLVDRLHITSAGNVGIGTTAPLFNLDVQGNQSATGAARIYNTNTGSNSVGLDLQLGYTTTSSNNANHFTDFLDGNGNIRGDIRANNTGVQFQTSGIADFAEYMAKDPNTTIPWGAILCLGNDGNMHPCDSKYINIAGVASENPSFVGGKDNGTASITVGLTGQIETLVSTMSGNINPGDPIALSSIPGVGLKATKTGPIIGKAVEAFDGTKNTIACPTMPSAVCGKIIVLVTQSWYDPSVQLTSSGDLNIAGSLPSTLPAAPSITDTAALVSNNSLLRNPSDATTSATMTDSLTQLGSEVSLLQTQYASLSGQMTKLSQIDDLSQRVSSLEKLMPGVASSLQASSNGFSGGDATISGQLTVTGKTLLSDVGITGNVSMGLLTINGMGSDLASPAAEINTLSGPLKLQSLALNGVDIENGKVSIDTNGDIQSSGAVTAQKYNIDTTNVLGASLGESTISSGESKVDVNTTAVTSNSKIFVTSESLISEPLTVTHKTKGKSFTVELAMPATQDVKFNWWIVN